MGVMVFNTSFNNISVISFHILVFILKSLAIIV